MTSPNDPEYCQNTVGTLLAKLTKCQQSSLRLPADLRLVPRPVAAADLALLLGSDEASGAYY
eukprot:scaffold116381_cov39-Phaeocystis_antarctica.AAC.2